MSARPEGSVSLPVLSSIAMVLSLTPVVTSLSEVPKFNGQPGIIAESSRTAPKPDQILRLGSVATQENFHFSLSRQALETTTTTNTAQPEATSFSLQISLDQVMNYIMSIANSGVPKITPTVYAEWYKTHECEEREAYNSHHNLIGGGWHVNNPSPSDSSGGLGIKNYNYLHYLTNPPNLPNLIQLGFPVDQSQATPVEQIIVAERIEPNAPEQNVCDGW